MRKGRGRGEGGEREERKGRRGKGGEMERENILGHVPFANESFLLCVGDKLYLQPLQRVIEVVKCLQ